MSSSALVKRFVVEQCFGYDNWENVWTTWTSEDPEHVLPVSFETREEAEEAMREHLRDMDRAVALKEIEEGYDAEDFRVSEVELEEKDIPTW